MQVPTAATSLRQKKAMGKGTYERSTRHRTDSPKASSRTSVKEQMTKRDADLARAMESLEAVAQDVSASIAKFAASAVPGKKVLSLPAAPERNRGFPKEFGLAADISRVVFRLKLLQAAVEKAARLQQRSSAAALRDSAS